MARSSLTVSQVAQRSGYAPSALRFYEDRGLIAATRTSGNQRRYERVVLRRLAFIRAASNIGLTLDEIAAELATLPAGRTPTAADWRRISQDWRARLDDRIAAIEALRDRLDGCIGCGCLSLGSCSLYNPQDVIGTRTTGAGRLPELLRAPQPARGIPESVVGAG